MSENTTEDERPHGAAERIARERLAEELDPARFGRADDLADMLAAVAADLRADDVTAARVDAACVHLELVQEALRDVSELHGWGWEDRSDSHPQPEPDREPNPDPVPGLPPEEAGE
jgi:hypothetical protein